MIANFEYGNFDITLCNKYKINKYKDCVLNSGVVGNSIYVSEEKSETLEDYAECVRLEGYDFKPLKIKAGTKIGIFNVSDSDYSDDVYGGYRLDGEVIFNNDSILYHDITNEDLTGELTRWALVLEDDKYVSGSGEYSLITKTNSTDEFNKFNAAINKEFDIIILSNS